MSYALSDLTVAVARPEQVRQTRLNTFDHWGKSRGFADESSYLRRDELMEREAWAKLGRLTTWILVPHSTVNPETGVSSAGADQILSHVETYRRPAFSYNPGATSPTTCFAFGIASVYTPEPFRKRGYGKRMLQILHYIIAPASSLPPFPKSFGQLPVLPAGHAARDGLFSVLYSDVGEAFYRRCTIGENQPGWVEQGSVGHEWSLPLRRDVDPPSGWRWLATADDVKALEGALDADMKDRVARGEVGDSSQTRVGFSAAQDLLPLHAHRALLSPAFPDSQPPTTPTSFGLASTSTSSALFYYPSHEPPPYKGTWPSPADKTLLITATLSAVPWSVVEAAAAREGCTRIEIWGEEPIPDGWPAGQAFTRDEHLSQLAWYGPAEADPPQLVFNQKYAWC